MKNKIEISWLEDMAFEATINDHKIVLDASAEVGGKDRGPRPKPLTLVALAGCTGIDVVSLLKKMRVEYEGLKIEVEGELTEEHPKTYQIITVHYIFKGKELPADKIEKAVHLSLEKYCGVTAMLAKSAKIEHRITLEENGSV